MDQWGKAYTAHVYGTTVNWCENNYFVSLDLLLGTLLSPESWAETINQEEFTLEMKHLSISETGSWLFVASKSFGKHTTSVSSSVQKPFADSSCTSNKSPSSPPSGAHPRGSVPGHVLSCWLVTCLLPVSPLARTPHKPRAYLLCSRLCLRHLQGCLALREHLWRIRVCESVWSIWLLLIETWALGSSIFSPARSHQWLTAHGGQDQKVGKPRQCALLVIFNTV